MRKIKERAGQQGWLNVAFGTPHLPLPHSSSCQEVASTPNLGKWGPTYLNPASRASSLVIMADWLITDIPSCRKYWKIRTRHIFFFSNLLQATEICNMKYVMPTRGHYKLRAKIPKRMHDLREESLLFPWDFSIPKQYLKSWAVSRNIWGWGDKKNEFRVPHEGRARVKNLRLAAETPWKSTIQKDTSLQKVQDHLSKPQSLMESVRCKAKQYIPE